MGGLDSRLESGVGLGWIRLDSWGKQDCWTGWEPDWDEGTPGEVSRPDTNEEGDTGETPVPLWVGLDWIHGSGVGLGWIYFDSVGLGGGLLRGTQAELPESLWVGSLA